MVRITKLGLVGIVTVALGCRSSQSFPTAEFVDVSQAIQQTQYASHSVLVDAIPAEANFFEGPRPVEDYIQIALARNPDVDAARSKIAALAYQVPVAASLQDPMFTVTALPAHVQTAAGQQELMVGASQKVPWFGKLDVRAGIAEAQTNAARAQLAAVELAVIAEVKRAYYELYFVQQSIAVTEAEQQLLADIRDVANTRYKTGGTNQQDVLRAELEISSLENELISLRQQYESSRAKLARLLHVGPSSRLSTIETLPHDTIPTDLEQLQARAVQARPELHAKFAEVGKERLAVEMANLEYKPDFTFGVSWIDVSSAGLSPIANGRDAVLLSVGSNLPIYQKRLDSSVRAAQAKTVAAAREYDALRDRTLEQVTDLFTTARTQQQMLSLFQENILPKAKQTLEVSSQAYNVGQVDFLQLIDNWRQLLRYELAIRRLEANLNQTMAELEKVVGGDLREGVVETDVTERSDALPSPAVIKK